MVRAGLKASLAAVIAIGIGSIAVGCDSDEPSKSVDRSRVAKAYVMAIVEEHDREKALEVSPGRESGIDFEIERFRETKMHVLEGPIECPIDPLTAVPKPCFAFRLEGEPIPTQNPRRGSVSFGTLSVGVSPIGRPVVVKTGFLGGGRTVDIP